MDGAGSEGEPDRRCGDVPRSLDRKTEAEAVEANDHESDVRGRGLHAEASKVRALRSSDRTSVQESARYSPRIEDNALFGYYRSEEESAEQIVHRAGSDHEGNDHRGECERVGIGDGVGKGRMGYGRKEGLRDRQVRAGNEQSGERWMHQRDFACVVWFRACLRQTEHIHTIQ